MTALDRAKDLMAVPLGQLPCLALACAKMFSDRMGMCGEVCLTAYAAYAEIIEGLPADDPAYEADDATREFFKHDIKLDFTFTPPEKHPEKE